MVWDRHPGRLGWAASSAAFMSTHLLLPQDEHTSWLDGVPGCQVFPSAELLPILECFPHAISSGPGDADVMPLAITNKQGQLCDLWVSTGR